MIITEEIFQYFCSTSANPIGYGILRFVDAQIEAAKGALRGLMGAEAYAAIRPMDLAMIAETKEQDLIWHAYAYVCRAAFEKAIPSLDLTLSPTGFGVVSNQNVAPASADRVERLRREMRDGADEALDGVIEALRGNPAWCETPMAKRWFSTMIWKGELMRPFGYLRPLRSHIAEHSRAISAAEVELRNLISSELFDEICAAYRRGRETDAQAVAADLCVNFIAARVGGVKAEADYAKRALLGYLDKAGFETYEQSSAYAANHFKPYENSKDDACYFFG